MAEIEVLRSRFLEQVDLSDPDGCWPWLGGLTNYGYGQFYLGRVGLSNMNAHRAAYLLFVEDPGDLHVDHLCRNRLCVNPDHLEPVTAGTNVLRGEGITATNARKTECVNGHPLEGANLYLRRDRKSRECRQCHRDASMRYAQRKKEHSG